MCEGSRDAASLRQRKPIRKCDRRGVAAVGLVSGQHDWPATAVSAADVPCSQQQCLAWLPNVAHVAGRSNRCWLVAVT